MQKLNILRNYPNQDINFFVNSQSVSLKIYMRNNEFYADMLYNKIEVIKGTKVVNNVPINLYANESGFVGYVYFKDDTESNAMPTIENIGVTFNLYYSEDKPNE